MFKIWYIYYVIELGIIINSIMVNFESNQTWIFPVIQNWLIYIFNFDITVIKFILINFVRIIQCTCTTNYSYVIQQLSVCFSFQHQRTDHPYLNKNATELEHFRLQQRNLWEIFQLYSVHCFDQGRIPPWCAQNDNNSKKRKSHVPGLVNLFHGFGLFEN